MAANFWQGKLVRLRAVEPDDWPLHFEWDRNTEGERLTDDIYPPRSTIAAQQWAGSQSTKPFDGHTFRLQIEAVGSGDMVGTINSHSCNPRSGTFAYGIAVMDAYHRQGYASEAVILFLRYFFQELRYQKVTITVFSFNTPSIKLHEKLGFQLEGRIRRTKFTRGQFYDELYYGMTVEEFREKHVEYLE